MAELRQWAPSRWSPDKIRLFLKHMRFHVLLVPTRDDYDLEGAGSALMSIDIARSKLELVHQHGFRRLQEHHPEETAT